MASVYSSKIVTDILKAIDAKLEKFKTYVLNTVANRQISGDQIESESLKGSNFGNECISSRILNASQIFADEGFVDKMTTDVVTSKLGSSLRFESNTEIQSIVESVSVVAATANDAKDVALSGASDLANYIVSTNDELENLQGQIDGSIMTWFYEVAPTANNPPAADWTTTEQKNIHLGDLYYDTITGYCYRWQVQSNLYSWQRISDTDVTKALEDASKAQDTADNKRRVFVSQPSPPYDIGDIWAQGAGGELMRCQTAKAQGQSYLSSDWVKASKYTDDTVALRAEGKADTNTSNITSLTSRVQTAELKITPEAITSTVRSSTEYINDLNSIMIIDSNDPPEDAPEEGKIWADGGVSPIVFRRWRGADVPTDRNYTKNESGSLITIDNTKGDVESISVSAPEATEDIEVTVGSNVYAIPLGESIDIPPVIGLNILTPSDGTVEVVYSGSGWATVNDTSALQEGLDELGDETADILNSLSSVSTAITQTASDVSVIKTETLVDLNGRVKNIESGVKVDGSIVDLGSSESIYGARVSHIGFRVSQTDQIEPIFAAERGRVLAQAMQMGVIVARKTSTGGWAWDV